MIAQKNITGIILAGGKSSRMGSDKGLMHYEGKSFIQYSIEALKPIVSTIIIVSNNNEYDQFGYSRKEDTVEEFGPVAGIYAGLESSLTAYNLILSCDIPLIRTEVLESLVQNSKLEEEVILLKSQGRLMPLIALYNKECHKKFKRAIEQREHKLMNVLSECSIKIIELQDEDSMYTTNVNTKHQLKEIENGSYC
ncbi:molybdenum cofactor guanylyltransferase [Tenacibaculum sp. 190524A05c]|uniref:Probable molybdenum cofactor guanylyltransferase n=1 Tax=Tenacibaculum platacis TaxID=3137852 RepID=A0ABM9NT82_9FLAO